MKPGYALSRNKITVIGRKETMTDDQAYKLVEDFANDHAMAKDKIKVAHTPHHTSYTAIPATGAHYEDCVYLSQQVNGADSFMFWLRRNGYKIVKEKK